MIEERSCTSGKLSIFYYESEKSVGENFKELLGDVFREAGFEPIIKLVIAGTDEADSENLLSEEYFDVVVSDLSLGNIQDKFGLYFLAKIRELNPDVITGAFSSYDLSHTDSGAIVPSGAVDLYFQKSQIKNRHYIARSASTIREKIKINPYAFVNACPALEAEDMRGVLFDVNRALRKLTYVGAPESQNASIGAIDLHKIEGGYSGCLVFRMVAKTCQNVPCLDAVVKVAVVSETVRSDLIAQESRNYQRWAKWNLPQARRPELLGTSFGGNSSVLCYSFGNSDARSSQTLKTYVKNDCDALVRSVIDQIFDPNSRQWYHISNIDPDCSIQEVYQERIANPVVLKKQRIAFRREFSKHDTSDQNFVRIGGYNVANPDVALFTQGVNSMCSTCITHGDLNCGNILLEIEGKAVKSTLIDFSESGIGHVFVDYIALEISLRLDTAKGKIPAIESLFRKELSLNRKSSGRSNMDKTISYLRNNAFQTFPDEPIKNYYFGLAAMSFEMIAFEPLSKYSKRILAALTASSIVQLETLEMVDI